MQQFGLQSVAGLLALFFIIRLMAGSRARLKELKYLAWVTGAAGILLLLFAALFEQQGWLTFYPVLVNICLLALFSSSLWQKQTLVERLARLQDPKLPDSGIEYTRTVTKVWCLFFLINGSIALITCFLSLSIWTLYNGLISYLAMGALFGGEFLVRKWLQKQQPSHS